MDVIVHRVAQGRQTPAAGHLAVDAANVILGVLITWTGSFESLLAVNCDGQRGRFESQRNEE